MAYDYRFTNLCGQVHTGGNVTFTTPDGNSVLSPVGNRITVFDLVKYVRLYQVEFTYGYRLRARADVYSLTGELPTYSHNHSLWTLFIFTDTPAIPYHVRIVWIFVVLLSHIVDV